MARYSIYAVAYGVDPYSKKVVRGIKCRTWNECKMLVSGVKDAKYKGFLTDVEADAWLNKMDKLINPSNDNNEQQQPSAPIDSNCLCSKCQMKNDINYTFNAEEEQALKSRFIDVCTARNFVPRDVLNKLMKSWCDIQESYTNDYNDDVPW